MNPDWTSVLSPIVGPMVGVLLTFIARYIRDAARALQERNSALDALATAAEKQKEERLKDRGDLNEAWAHIRKLEGALSVLTQKDGA